MTSYRTGRAKVLIQMASGEICEVGSSLAPEAPAQCAVIFDLSETPTGTGTMHLETLADWVNFDSLVGSPRRDLTLCASRAALLAGIKS